MANVILSLGEQNKNITVLLDQTDQMAFSLGDAQLVYTDLKWEELPQSSGLVKYDFDKGRYKIVQPDTQVIEDSNNVVTSGAVYKHIEDKLKDLDTDFTETDPTVPSYVKNITQQDINNWNNKVDNTVDNLVNYYLKSETYTKDEIASIINSINGLSKQIVDALPTENIDENTIYLVPKTDGNGSDYYNEYLYINGSFEFIGSTEVDLKDYVKNTDYATQTKAGVGKADNTYGIQMYETDKFGVTRASDNNIIEKTHKYRPIVPSNLDLAVKVGLTTNTTELTGEEKASALNWLGAMNKDAITLTQKENGAYKLTVVKG